MIGVVIELRTLAYDNLKFPIDIICITITSIGLTLSTFFLLKIINNKSLINFTTTTIPVLLTLKYFFDLILSSSVGTDIHDLFLSIFSITYPLAILATAIQTVSDIRIRKFWIIISSLTGLAWTLINIIETKRFLEYRQSGPVYSEEPQSNWIFVLIMFMILLWTTLRINKLKYMKINNDW